MCLCVDFEKLVFCHAWQVVVLAFLFVVVFLLYVHIQGVPEKMHASTTSFQYVQSIYKPN